VVLKFAEILNNTSVYMVVTKHGLIYTTDACLLVKHTVCSTHSLPVCEYIILWNCAL